MSMVGIGWNKTNKQKIKMHIFTLNGLILFFCLNVNPTYL